MKKLIRLACAAVAATMVCGAQETAANDGSPQKLLLRISMVETVDTRSEKSWTPPNIPPVAQKLPYTESQIVKGTTEQAAEMQKANDMVDRANKAAAIAVASKNWAASAKFMNGVRAKLQGTTFGRQIMQALDKFAGHAGSSFNPGCIEFFHRLDNMEGKDEAKFTTGEGPQVYAGAYFIKLIFDDPSEKTFSTTVGGGQMSRTFFTQKLTYQVMDNGGKVVCAGNVKKDKAVVDATGEERSEVTVDLLDACMEEAAKKINDHFVATVVFSAVPAVKDPEFNGDAATLEVDGVTRQFGAEVPLLTSETHKVDVTMDGYVQQGTKRMRFPKSANAKIVMKSTMCELTVTVKGGAGFAESAATIELVAAGPDGVAESLTSGEASKVGMGKYTLKVSADGYVAQSKPVTLTKNRQAVTVMLKKEAAPAAEAGADAR